MLRGKPDEVMSKLERLLERYGDDACVMDIVESEFGLPEDERILTDLSVIPPPQSEGVACQTSD